MMSTPLLPLSPQERQDFVRFALAHQALLIGDFTLKSGQKSPYFFNLGRFDHGQALHDLAHWYAKAITACPDSYQSLFGLAYKGIPLVAAVAMVLAQTYQRNLPYAFNRKEPKTHGEKGVLVGAELTGSVLCLDDVLTAGTSFSQSLPLLPHQPPEQAVTLMVALDRQQCPPGDTTTAAQRLQSVHGVQVVALIQASDILAYLEQHPPEDPRHLHTLKTYLQSLSS